MILREYILSFGIPAEIYDTWIHLPSDKEMLGSLLQDCDRDSETLQGKETYGWYRAFAEHIKPLVVAEIGVRYGYTLKALQYDSSVSVHGFDNESYISDCLTVVKSHFPNGNFIHCDTQDASTLPVENVDIFHVDGDHSSQGAYNDLHLAFQCVRKGGWILIDDVKGLYYETQQDFDVRQAANQFCTELKLQKIFIPTYRGMYAIQK